MDNFVDSLLLGLLWWDASWLTAIAVEHSEKFVDYEALAFDNWGAHKSNAQALKYEIEETIDQASTLETSLINKPGVITDQETKEVIDLTAKVQRLEKELLDEQNVIKAEEKAKIAKYVVYPTAVIVGVKLAWSLTKWFFPNAVTVLS